MAHEARHLLGRMLSHTVAMRPMAADVAKFPLFLGVGEKMALLEAVQKACKGKGNRSAAMRRKVNLLQLQVRGGGEIGGDWRAGCADLWAAFRAGGVALRDVAVGAVVVEVEGAVEATGRSQVVAHPTAKMPTITATLRGWSLFDSHERVIKAGLAL